MRTTSSTSSSSNTSCDFVSEESSKSCALKKSYVVDTEDRWLGVATRPSRQIGNSPFFLSRDDQAREPDSHPLRLNHRGYDMDEPKHAILKYESTHPISPLSKIWNGFTDALCTLFSVGIPKMLSLSAGKDKQRIDQKVVLTIVREAVDKFPELKIRINKKDYDLLATEDQLRWHKEMSIIRRAQHDFIAYELAKVYPGHINQEAETFLYTGGRATGCLRVLYCSVDEYVALYWSDWGLMSTDSGSYDAHVYDYITEGHNINWNANNLEYNPDDFEITVPGEYTFLGRGDRKIWSFEGPCGMVDHAFDGDIMKMAHMPISGNISTGNGKAMGDLLRLQTRAVAHEYAQRFRDKFGDATVEVKNITKVSDEDLQRARNYFAPILQAAKQS